MGKKRTLDFRIIAESEIDENELRNLAHKTAQHLSRSCSGKFLIAVAVISPEGSEAIWDLMEKSPKLSL